MVGERAGAGGAVRALPAQLVTLPIERPFDLFGLVALFDLRFFLGDVVGNVFLLLVGGRLVVRLQMNVQIGPDNDELLI